MFLHGGEALSSDSFQGAGEPGAREDSAIPSPAPIGFALLSPLTPICTVPSSPSPLGNSYCQKIQTGGTPPLHVVSWNAPPPPTRWGAGLVWVQVPNSDLLLFPLHFCLENLGR